MLGFATFPALLPLMRDVWALSGKEAGWIAGAYFGGYMLAVPLLSSLTDRFDARRIYFASCLLAAAGLVGFAVFARGPLTAGVLQAVSGAGLAGTYMPGLRLLADRVGGVRQSRFVAFYTSTFGIGTSASLLFAGWSAAALGWQLTFALAGVGPLVAGCVVIGALRAMPRSAHAPSAGAAAGTENCSPTAPCRATCSATRRIAGSFSDCARGWWLSWPSAMHATPHRSVRWHPPRWPRSST